MYTKPAIQTDRHTPLFILHRTRAGSEMHSRWRDYECDASTGMVMMGYRNDEDAVMIKIMCFWILWSGKSEVGRLRFVELLTVDSTPAVGNFSLDKAQNAVGLVDGSFAQSRRLKALCLLEGPPWFVEHELGGQFLWVKGSAWRQRYCWRGAHRELASVCAMKGRDFSLLNSQSNISKVMANNNYQKLIFKFHLGEYTLQNFHFQLISYFPPISSQTYHPFFKVNYKSRLPFWTVPFFNIFYYFLYASNPSSLILVKIYN